MDTFFQKLRDIQKKERNDGPLSEIDDTFYDDASNYLQHLLKIVDDNPLSLEAYQLRDAKRITVEICERREVKILTTALSNVQKSHDLINGERSDSSLHEELPLNITADEEKLYFDLVDTIVAHRQYIMHNESEMPKRPQPTQKVEAKPEVVLEPEAEAILNAKPVDEPVIEDKNGSVTSEVSDMPQSVDVNEPSVGNVSDVRLDESQIAMMFGEIPDAEPDVPDYVYAENEPVEDKKRTDIITPFKPPKAPETDTVALQNNEGDHKKKQQMMQNSSFNDTPVEDKQTIQKSDDLEQKQIDQTQQIQQENQQQVDDVEESENKIHVVEDNLNSEEIVEFKEDLNTDILDADEKSYGPFNVQDVVVLPKSIVKILKMHDVIDIL